LENFVAILAAGKGSRMGLPQPKQFEMLNGKTILEHSADTFEKHPSINGIYVVVHKDFIEKTKQLLNVENRPKIIDVIAGGEERTDSSWNAIMAMDKLEINLLIHDAARPFVSNEIITRTIEALKTHSAVSVAIPATDTIYLCDGENKIASSPKRNCVYLAQTPQAARLPIFKQAFELAQKNNQHLATDDANVILNYLPGEKIHIVLGDVANRKITFMGDLNEK
jgi:2-C-methyl-D-erythritol 4-phosphate cytidylyltransferase